MEQNQNNQGVCCDVEDCIHNVEGCNCEMNTIKVTTGKTENAHFCKTYECKEDCQEWKRSKRFFICRLKYAWHKS